jgi:hypothetical protein
MTVLPSLCGRERTHLSVTSARRFNCALYACRAGTAIGRRCPEIFKLVHSRIFAPLDIWRGAAMLSL